MHRGCGNRRASSWGSPAGRGGDRTEALSKTGSILSWTPSVSLAATGFFTAATAATVPPG